MKEPIKQYKPKEPAPDLFREKLDLPKIKKELPKAYKRLSCPACTEALNAEHIDLPNNVAKCGSCHVVFSIAEEVEGLKVKQETKQEIFRPEGIDLFYYKGEMEITLPQNIHGLEGFLLGMFIMLAPLATLLYFKKGISVYFPIFFAIGTLFFLYRLFTYSKAKTYIDINDRSLTIKHRPNNLKKDKAFPAEDIDQIYLKQAADGSGYFTLHMIVNGPKGQQHQKLITVNTLSKAKYLEQEIEKYLGIEDRKVPEELK